MRLELPLLFAMAFVWAPKVMALNPTSFRCHLALKGQSLIAQAGEQEFRIVDLHFETIGFLGPQIQCQRWLDDWVSKPAIQPSKIEIRELWTGDSNQNPKPARLAGPYVYPLYERCAQSQRCSVPFPYKIRYQWGRLFQKESESLPKLDRGILDSKICQNKSDSALLPENDGLQDPKELLSMAPLRVGIVPWDSPVDLALQVVEQSKEGPVYVSAMVTSASQWFRIAKLASAKPRVNVYLIVDLLAMAVDPEISLLLQNRPSNLRVLFAHRSEANPKYFHIKTAVDSGSSGLWMVTSGNFKSYSDSQSLDWSFLFQDQTSAKDLSLIWAQRALSYCSSFESLECSLESRFTARDRIQNDLRLSNAEFCSALAREPHARIQKSKPSRYFWSRNDVAGVEAGLRKFLSGTQRELLGFSDVWDSEEVQRDLQGLKLNGRRLLLWQGLSQEEMSDESMGSNPLVTFQVPQRLSRFRSHLKGFLRDSEHLWWSTANVTNNGLRWNDELAFVTDHPQLLDLGLQLKRTLFTDQLSNSAVPLDALDPEIRVWGPKETWNEVQAFFQPSHIRLRTQDWIGRIALHKSRRSLPICTRLGRRLAYEWNDELKKCLVGQAP